MHNYFEIHCFRRSDKNASQCRGTFACNVEMKRNASGSETCETDENYLMLHFSRPPIMPDVFLSSTQVFENMK